MSLTLHFHPLSSFCQKVLVALYEAGTPFTPNIVDLSDAAQRDALLALWPIGKFPMLVDDARGETVAESTIIIEYLARHYPGATQLIPADVDRARETRALDRFFDLYVDMPMQTIVGDRRRPADAKDPFGVDEARRRLRTAYRMIDKAAATRTWAMGDAFTMADCAAAPALYYANLVEPFGDDHPNVARYFERLMARPSFARAVSEADPYRHLFPRE
jgi:glutathione S-transferase